MKLLSSATIRRCLVADPGYLIITADFDQIELRVAAALAGEESLIDAARRGESLHKVAALKLFGKDYTPDQYRYTKNVNFGWLYGGGADTLSRQAKIPFSEAAKIIKEYQSEFPALTAYKRSEQNKILQSAFTPSEFKYYRFLRSQMYQLRSDTVEGRIAKARLDSQIKQLCKGKIGYCITPFGRRLVVDAIKAYTVVNYKVQSASRDIMAGALLDVMADPELESTVLLPIHDEILGQAPKKEAEYFAERYGKVMSTEFMGVPITASGKVYGMSWGHGYKAK